MTRDISRRTLLAAGALSVASATVAGCSRSADNGPMSFWNFYAPGGPIAAQSKWFTDAVAQWNKRQSRIADQVRLRYIPNPDYINGSILSTAFAAGNGPDIFLLSPGDFLRYYNGGVLTDLTPHLAKGAQEDYLRGALDTRLVGGRVYGLPMEMEPLAVYYSVAAFEQAHLAEADLPTTWDQLLNVADKLRTTKRFGVLFETTPGYYQNFTWYPFMWMGSGSPVDPSGSRSTFNERGVHQALELWGSAIKEGIAPRSVLGTGAGDITSNLDSGYTAMQQSGVWSLAEHAAGPHKKNPIGVFRLPTPPGGDYVTVQGGWAFVANARGPNPSKAAEFCAWALASVDPAGVERARQWNTVAKTNLPPRRSVHEAAARHGAFKGLFGQFSGDIVHAVRGEPRYPPQIYKAISDAIQAVQLGGDTPASAAARASDVIQSFLGGYHGVRIT